MPPKKKRKFEVDVTDEKPIGRPRFIDDSAAGNVRKLLNKLTEATTPTTAASLKALFDGGRFARHALTEALAGQLLVSCLDPIELGPVLLYPFATLIRILQTCVGADIAAEVVRRHCVAVQELWAAEGDAGKKLINGVSLLSYYFVMSVISIRPIADFCSAVAQRATEKDMDVLLALVKSCGHQLKREDTAFLPSVLRTLKTRYEERMSQSETSTARYRILFDILTKLNKERKGKERTLLAGEMYVKMHSIVRAAKAEFEATDDASLDLTWSALCADRGTGRWWLPPPAGVRRDAPPQPEAPKEEGTSAEVPGDPCPPPPKKAPVEASTEKFRVHSNLDIHNIINDNLEVSDLLESLHKSGTLQRKKRAVIETLLSESIKNGPTSRTCCSALCKLGKQDKEIRFTVKLCVWEQLQGLLNTSEFSLSHFVGAAKAVVQLVISGVAPLFVLKVFDIPSNGRASSIPPKPLFLLTVILCHLLHSASSPLVTSASRLGANLKWNDFTCSLAAFVSGTFGEAERSGGGAPIANSLKTLPADVVQGLPEIARRARTFVQALHQIPG